MAVSIVADEALTTETFDNDQKSYMSTALDSWYALGSLLSARCNGT